MRSVNVHKAYEVDPIDVPSGGGMCFKYLHTLMFTQRESVFV